VDKFDRLYKLHSILRDRRTPIPRRGLTERLDCHERTVFRLIRILQNCFHAPIAWHEELGGYHYRRDAGGEPFELPGLWFNAKELHALIVFDRLFESLEPGLLGEHLAPLCRRTGGMLRHKWFGLAEAARRIRVIGIAARPAEKCFDALAAATQPRARSLGRRRALASAAGRPVHDRWPLRARIKQLRKMAQPQYRLRVGDIRVFYDINENRVEVLAIVPEIGGRVTAKPRRPPQIPPSVAGSNSPT
jgi:mRNA-degrading endonuclease RelE of RelBE toxin-antitoxin system